jgi:uncharacterized membrane protein YphA (DoxX/SURF4 family)
MFKNSLLNLISSLYSRLIKIGEHFQSLFLFYIRITWGYQFFLSVQPTDTDPTIFFKRVCGFLLLIGFGSRLAALPMVIWMFMTLSTQHEPGMSQLRFLLDPLSLAKETPYPFLMTGLTIFIFGPGKISIDAWIKRIAERRAEY